MYGRLRHRHNSNLQCTGALSTLDQIISRAPVVGGITWVCEGEELEADDSPKNHEDDEVYHREDEVPQVGDEPVDPVAEPVHLHHDAQAVELLVYQLLKPAGGEAGGGKRESRGGGRRRGGGGGDPYITGKSSCSVSLHRRMRGGGVRRLEPRTRPAGRWYGAGEEGRGR